MVILARRLVWAAIDCFEGTMYGIPTHSVPSTSSKLTHADILLRLSTVSVCVASGMPGSL